MVKAEGEKLLRGSEFNMAGKPQLPDKAEFTYSFLSSFLKNNNNSKCDLNSVTFKV